jgi:tRNA (adenine22-N1)-methyltransferase
VALSPKLQIIYDQLLPGEDVWDLCCDHGYLGWAALASGNFAEIHFVDRVAPIIENLKRQIIPHDPTRKARFHALGAETLQEPLTGTVVIAGVGAYTAFEILEKLWKRDLLKAKRLVLSPQRDEQKFLQWLQEFDAGFYHRYQLKNEQSVREGRRPLWVYVCGE